MSPCMRPNLNFCINAYSYMETSFFEGPGMNFWSQTSYDLEFWPWVEYGLELLNYHSCLIENALTTFHKLSPDCHNHHQPSPLIRTHDVLRRQPNNISKTHILFSRILVIFWHVSSNGPQTSMEQRVAKVSVETPTARKFMLMFIYVMYHIMHNTLPFYRFSLS